MDLPPMEPSAFSTLTITSHLCGSNSFSYLLTYRICETAFVTSSVDLADSIIVLNSVSYVTMSRHFCLSSSLKTLVRSSLSDVLAEAPGGGASSTRINTSNLEICREGPPTLVCCTNSVFICDMSCLEYTFCWLNTSCL